MKVSELKLKEFTIKCLLDSYNKEVNRKLEKFLNESNTTEEFVNKIMDESYTDNELYDSQGFIELCKEYKDVWSFVRHVFGEKSFKTDSDRGGVMIGNENFNVIISNDYGDGTTRCGIFKRMEEDGIFLRNIMRFITVVEGEFNIYFDDCRKVEDNYVKETLNGKYAIYAYEGFVAFIEY